MAAAAGMQLLCTLALASLLLGSGITQAQTVGDVRVKWQADVTAATISSNQLLNGAVFYFSSARMWQPAAGAKVTLAVTEGPGQLSAMPLPQQVWRPAVLRNSPVQLVADQDGAFSLFAHSLEAGVSTITATVAYGGTTRVVAGGSAVLSWLDPAATFLCALDVDPAGQYVSTVGQQQTVMTIITQMASTPIHVHTSAPTQVRPSRVAFGSGPRISQSMQFRSRASNSAAVPAGPTPVVGAVTTFYRDDGPFVAAAGGSSSSSAGSAQVAGMAVSTPESAGHASVTYTRSTVGTTRVTAVAKVGNVSVPCTGTAATAWQAPSIVLSADAPVMMVGSSAKVTVTVQDSIGAAMPDLTFEFSAIGMGDLPQPVHSTANAVTGQQQHRRSSITRSGWSSRSHVEDVSATATTGPDGTASTAFARQQAGSSTIVATTTINGTPFSSQPLVVTWVEPQGPLLPPATAVNPPAAAGPPATADLPVTADPPATIVTPPPATAGQPAPPSAEADASSSPSPAPAPAPSSPTPSPTPTPPSPQPTSSADFTKIVLSAQHIEQQVHEPIQLTARVLDSMGQPVGGIPVDFFAQGGCEGLTVTPDTVVSDMSGMASTFVMSEGPGAATVVAAANNSMGVVVLSQAAHIYFAGGYGYAPSDDSSPSNDYYAGNYTAPPPNKYAPGYAGKHTAPKPGGYPPKYAGNYTAPQPDKYAPYHRSGNYTAPKPGQGYAKQPKPLPQPYYGGKPGHQPPPHHYYNKYSQHGYNHKEQGSGYDVMLNSVPAVDPAQPAAQRTDANTTASTSTDNHATIAQKA